LIGAHVHDVKWPASDHRPPFTGTLDYAELFKFFPKNCPLVWEINPGHDAAKIKTALAKWRELLPERD
jgi:sugar phosphate isomerase/epimerase